MSERTRPSVSPRRRSATIAGVSVVGVVVLLVLFVGPGSFHVWSSQRAQTRALDSKIEALDRANATLAARARQLRDPEAVRDLARGEYGMVPKGAKAYAILPAPVPDARPAGTWPFVDLQPSTRTQPSKGR